MSDSRQVIASIFDSVSDFTLQTFIKIPEGESVASAAKKMLGCKCTEAINVVAKISRSELSRDGMYCTES